MSSNSMSVVFLGALAILIFLLVILVVVYIVVNTRSKNEKKTSKNSKEKGAENKDEGNQTAKSYNKQSIFKFMNFEKIEDNMIIQKAGKRYLMIIECQGINYDLMSGLEKNSVEQGFLQFLNTLRYKIQIYVQTRTVNLSSSINSYKNRIQTIRNELDLKQAEYNKKIRSGGYTEKDLQKENLEIVRLRNLYGYGMDVINNTERMSLNKNILSKFYYIIIPYYFDEAGGYEYDESEIQNIAFSDLYTKAQTLINSLGVSGVRGKILDSGEITELLYAAYNRDESDVFSLKSALNAGYEELYSTSSNVLDKRMKELNKKIEEESVEKANNTIRDVVADSERQKAVKEKEEALDELIDKMAIDLIEKNKRSIGEDTAKAAIEQLSKEIEEEKAKKEKGGNVNEQKEGTETKTRRRRAKTA